MKNWDGKVDWVIGLDLPEAGHLCRAGLRGAFEGVRSGIPDLPVESLFGSRARYARQSKKVISDFLQRHPKDRHILIAAATDSSALGAVDAVREHKRQKHVVIVGQDCIAEAIAEMQKDGSPLIGSVSHEANSYGPNLIHLGLSSCVDRWCPPITMWHIRS